MKIPQRSRQSSDLGIDNINQSSSLQLLTHTEVNVKSLNKFQAAHQVTLKEIPIYDSLNMSQVKFPNGVNESKFISNSTLSNSAIGLVSVQKSLK